MQEVRYLLVKVVVLAVLLAEEQPGSRQTHRHRDRSQERQLFVCRSRKMWLRVLHHRRKIGLPQAPLVLEDLPSGSHV